MILGPELVIILGRALVFGNYALVGAYAEGDAGGGASSKSYIFNVVTGNLLHVLDNPNNFGTSDNDYFGISVSIDGNYALIGASDEDEVGNSASGKVYILN